jgi:hypothetical protein
VTQTMAQVLDAGRKRAGLSARDLWLGYHSLGGTADPVTLDAYLDGTATPTSAQYDVIAQTLNDVFVGRGENHPVPYAEDLAG